MKSLLQVIDLLYGYFLKALTGMQCLFLLAIRVYWGWLFLESGIGKITHIDKTIAYFTELHIPAPSLNAHFNAGLETVGGILLILGLGSRLVAVPLTINMVVAFITAESEKLVFFSDSNTFFGANAFPFLLASFLVLIFGPGFFSVDTLISWYRKRDQVTVGRFKLFCLLYVLFVLVYATIYSGFTDAPERLVAHWWNKLIVVALLGVAFVATQALIRKGIWSQEKTQSKQV